ncbi:ADP-dependent glucokinase isoform X2 [Nomia melanderi]|nr:ADP-dependent glucokinase isoform X2 [Nomia melanderi]
MPNETLFNELVAKARSYPSSYSTIGGNAAIMAMRFAKEGCDVTLAAKLTKSMYQMMPQVINIVGGEVKQDDIHLIMEYKRGDVWGPYSSVRANRYIIHSDTSNPMIRSLDPFDEFLSVTEPNLIVVSGLQMMDNYPFLEGERQKLLLKVKKQLLERPLSTKIHFEMASIVENEFFYELIESVLPYVDSLGVNEQEIASLKEFVVGGLSNVADSMPNVTVVLDQMRMVFELIRLKNIVNSSPRKLSRIHVHSLAYQVIFIEKGSEWKNTMAAAAKASLTAHRHVCATNHVDVKKAALMLDDRFLTSVKDGTEISLDINKPVSCWDEVLSGVIEKIPIQICVAPGLVCTETAQTAGGGDNISSAGLVLQV